MFESSGRVAKRREGHPSNEGVSSCTLGHREREDSVQWGLRPDLEEQQTASFLLHNTALVLIFDSASGWKNSGFVATSLAAASSSFLHGLLHLTRSPFSAGRERCCDLCNTGFALLLAASIRLQIGGLLFSLVSSFTPQVRMIITSLMFWKIGVISFVLCADMQADLWFQSCESHLFCLWKFFRYSISTWFFLEFFGSQSTGNLPCILLWHIPASVVVMISFEFTFFNSQRIFTTAPCFSRSFRCPLSAFLRNIALR